MMYFPILSSSFKEDECKQILKKKLEYLKEDIDNLIYWNKKYVDECNCGISEVKGTYNNDYLELQRLINKI